MIKNPMKTMLRGIGLAAALLAGAPPAIAESERPNILLIISDDIGLDATTEMYPGFIEDLVKQYGPSGQREASRCFTAAFSFVKTGFDSAALGMTFS